MMACLIVVVFEEAGARPRSGDKTDGGFQDEGVFCLASFWSRGARYLKAVDSRPACVETPL